MSNSQTANLGSLFGSAVAQGAVSDGTLDDIGVTDLGDEIMQGLSVDADSITATEVILVGILPDDSGSIRMSGNAQTVRDGHNLVIDSLGGAGSKKRDGILMMTRYLNGRVLFPFVPIGQAVRMDSHNYDPNLGTPLYDQTVVFLLTMLAKYQEFRSIGVPCRTISLVVTDGADVHSVKQTEETVAKLVKDMLLGEDHIISGMGIGEETFFRPIFQQMGIRDEWILTPGNNQKEIRQAFQTFSQSAVRASQHAGAFSLMGGFGG